MILAIQKSLKWDYRKVWKVKKTRKLCFVKFCAFWKQTVQFSHKVTVCWRISMHAFAVKYLLKQAVHRQADKYTWRHQRKGMHAQKEKILFWWSPLLQMLCRPPSGRGRLLSQSMRWLLSYTADENAVRAPVKKLPCHFTFTSCRRDVTQKAPR